MEKMIFVIPQVALKANPNIFPNITSIMIINNTVNIIVFPLFLQLLFHEILICFLIQVFRCIPSAHLFFQGADTLWFFVRSSLCIPLCLSCYSHYKVDIRKNTWYLYRNNIVYFAIPSVTRQIIFLPFRNLYRKKSKYQKSIFFPVDIRYNISWQIRSRPTFVTL